MIVGDLPGFHSGSGHLWNPENPLNRASPSLYHLAEFSMASGTGAGAEVRALLHVGALASAVPFQEL